VDALKRRGDVDVEVFSFPTGFRNYLPAARALRKRFGGHRFDLVHAHYGLCAWPALLARLGPVAVTVHGGDVFHPRARPVTRAALPFAALTAAASRELAETLPSAGERRRVAVLPMGVDLERFQPISRAQARGRLGLDPGEPFLLFPHDPARPLKRFDRAHEAAAGTRLHLLGGRVPPEEVPYWVNAANGVLVPSEAEGFGLSALEALACDVPVLATPVGIHPLALAGIEGALCAEWDPATWRAAAAELAVAPDPRVRGRDRAALFSADQMAARTVAAWRDVVGERDRTTRT
jgi:glycosyltransferase involved in cell wall biosynthesis